MVNAILFSAVQFTSSSSLPQSQACGEYQIRGIARRAKCGSRSIVVARMTKGENDVKLVLENEKETKKKMMKEVKEEQQGEPFLLRIGVALVTELLRLFSSFGSSQPEIAVEDVAPSAAVENQNVVEIRREDYERTYFLTGTLCCGCGVSWYAINVKSHLFNVTCLGHLYVKVSSTDSSQD